MSCVLDFYSDRLEELLIEGKQSELALVLRKGKTLDPAVINSQKKILLFLDSNLRCGDIFTRGNGTKYFVVSRQQSDGAVDCQAMMVNSYIKIQRLEKLYEDYDFVGLKANTISENTPCYFKDVSASMRYYDAGLLKDTTKIILVKATVDIKELDRVILNGNSYQVDNIDTGKYLNMNYIQLSEDTREQHE